MPLKCVKRLYCLVAILLIPLCTLAWRQPSLLNQKINIVKNRGTLRFYLAEIRKQGVLLSYSSSRLPVGGLRSVPARVYRLEELLHLLLDDLNISFALTHQTIAIYPQATQPKVCSINGFVYSNRSSKETLPQANIYIQPGNIRLQCNDYGFYAVNLKPGKYTFNVSFVGYESYSEVIDINNSKKTDFYLQGGVLLPVVTVDKPPGLSLSEHLGSGIRNIEAMPFAAGQSDPLKLLKQKAGVSNSNFSVRSGSPDENLILFDGVPIYHYNHFMGLLSIFNNDAVKRIDLYKGSFPARFQGRLSSVVDVKTRDGDMHEYHGSVNANFITASVMAEGPIVKDKASFLISARRSWIDGLSRLVLGKDNPLIYRLSDLNLKLNWASSPSSRFYVSVFSGSDKLRVNWDRGYNNTVSWHTNTATLKWTKTYGNVFQNTQFSFSDFSSALSSGNDTVARQFNTIRDYDLTTEIQYSYSNSLHSVVGFGTRISDFTSATGLEFPVLKRLVAVDARAYAQLTWQANKTTTVESGFNLVNFGSGDNYFLSFQPRLKLNLAVAKYATVFASYARMTQFYHQIGSNIGVLPTEFKRPSSKEQPPQNSETWELGYLANWQNGRASVIIYRKDYSNQLIFEPDPLTESSNDDFDETRLFRGDGFSKGLETEINHTFGAFEIQGAYTLATSKIRSSSLNHNRPFYSPYDLRHIANLTVNWKAGKRWMFTILANVSSGQAVTNPLSSVTAGSGTISVNNLDLVPNNYRLAASKSVSLGAARTVTRSGGQQSQFYFGMNNIIGRGTPVMVDTYFEEGAFKVDELRAFKFFPYVGYRYSF